MFSEQLPAAVRCCRGACAPGFDQQNNVFRLLYTHRRENKNPAGRPSARRRRCRVASQGCLAASPTGGKKNKQINNNNIMKV